jgi:4-hydroxy-2-oxoheptanedioate aldolase
MHMRRSRVAAILRSGQVACCTKINSCDPRVVEIAAMSGIDSVWLCQEHVPSTLHDLENQIRAAKMFDVDAIVRVPRGSYSDLIHPLEMDAAGIMVPHVMSAADARQIARQTRFHPTGRRPLDGGNADGAYCAIPAEEYIRDANRQRLVIVQIEDPEAVDELDEIAAVDGIDMLFFGPADFSQGIGKPYETDHPRVKEALHRTAEVSRKHGKFAGTAAGHDNLQELIDMGYQYLSLDADVCILSDGFARTAAAFGRRPVGPINRGDLLGL